MKNAALQEGFVFISTNPDMKSVLVCFGTTPLKDNEQEKTASTI